MPRVDLAGFRLDGFKVGESILHAELAALNLVVYTHKSDHKNFT